MSLIKLPSSGVEISEDTILSLMRNAGIKTEPPKHIFKKGDVAKTTFGTWRIIISYNGLLYSVDENGDVLVRGQDKFEEIGYEYVGRLKEMVKKW